MITIVVDGGLPVEADLVIVVPQKAIAEPGYIQAFCAGQSAHAKHDYHALAQTAYFQFQDDDLTVAECQGEIEVGGAVEPTRLGRGLVLYRRANGRIEALCHRGQSSKRLLESAYRYCTRWVRLDI